MVLPSSLSISLRLSFSSLFVGLTSSSLPCLLCRSTVVLTKSVGSFDAGYGSSIMSRLVRPKKAHQMWFLARFYTASKVEKMRLVNVVVLLNNIKR
ncbi:hypothetical protein GOBAR_AA30125 [Gossypium barbadense]|uniref:Secreted protein n=1 Tax=Gossypium barbadense TaxID=3634 RepID=A0A2P5WHJ4_GOSBA|nr:hypothetical protein GOBAR_AA30125 [Gossypium barbadense]